jgi:protein TonB
LLPVEGLKEPVPDPSLATPSRRDEPGSAPAGEAAGTAIPAAGLRSDPGGGFAVEGGRAGGGTAGTVGGAGDAATGTGPPGGGGSGDGGFTEILRRIEAAKHYPEEARRLGHRGTVAVRFRIGSDGTVAAAEVAASSGSSLLDAASLETVRRAAPLPLTPGWLLVRISYGLTEARP